MAASEAAGDGLDASGTSLGASDAGADRGTTGEGDVESPDASRPGDAAPPDAVARIDANRPDEAAAPDGDANASADADASADANPDGSGDATNLPATRPGDAAAGPPGDDSGRTAIGTASPPSPTSATAYLNNPAHTNAVVDPSLAPPLAAIWSFEPAIGVSVSSSPLIAGGRVYFIYGPGTSGSSEQLIAVDEHTGATIWGPVDLGTLQPVGQAYDGERVFIADRTGLVRAFDAASGAPAWTHGLGGSAVNVGPPTAYRGLLFVAADGTLTALDEADGQVRWTAPLDGAGQTSPAVTDDGVFVALGCQDNSAFDRVTGALLWHHLSMCTGLGATPRVYGGRLFVVEDEATPEHTDVFDARSGGFLATLPCFIDPTFDEGRAYCNQRTPLQAFDLTTGAQTWSFSGDNQLNLAPFAAGGTVYVASDTGKMFGIDEPTGALAWSTEADGLGAAAIAAAGEGVLLLQLYASSGVVAYAHVDLPDATVVLGDGSAPAAPLPLIPSASPIALALDATNVYWGDFGAAAVSSAPKGGGSPVTLWSSTATRPRGIAVDATNVYVLASGDGQITPSAIVAAPIAGGTPTTLATSPALLTGPIVAGPSAVYWIDGAIQSVPKAGGSVTSVVTGVTPSALAADAVNLYWSDDDGIHALPLTGGPDRLLGTPPNPASAAIGRHGAAALAVDDTNVYYVLDSGAGAGSVGYIPIAGGAAQVLASGRPVFLVAVAVDDRNVYWVEGEGTIQQGAIAAVPKTGGQVSVLAPGLSDPEAVAVDGTGVYFPSATGGIGKIPE